MPPNYFRLQMKVVGPYLLFATAWIILTDWQLLPALLGRTVPDFSWYQTAKGLLFVGTTGLLLYLLLGVLLRQLMAAQEELRLSEAHFRMLADNAHDVVYRFRFLPEPRLEYVSPSLHPLLGYTPEEFYQDPALSRRLIHPDDAEAMFAYFDVANDPKQSLEVRWLRKDGGFVWVQQRMRVERDDAGKVVAVEGISRDVTEQKRAEDALRASEERYRRLIEQASDGIIVIDRERRFREVNEQACSMLGYAREELFALTYPDIISPENLAQIPLQLEQVLQGDILRFERQYCRKDGSGFPADVSMARMDDGTVQIIIRDATDRKRYESGLIEAKQKADEMVRTKDAFLANMSHEIRTPLTAVIGFAKLLYDEAEGSVKEFAELIQHGGRRLLETLNSVLDLAQLRGGSLRLHLQPLDPIQEAQRTVQFFDVQARKKGLVLTLDVSPECPREILTDSGALGRILSNLVSNAVKFTQKGHITVRLSGEPDVIVFEIIDTGIGIGEEYQKHLFKEFSQEASGLSRPYEGNGLGLAITKQLVDLLQGEISVRSHPGNGSTFAVRLPFRSDPHNSSF